jgi:hypothetical protein
LQRPCLQQHGCRRQPPCAYRAAALSIAPSPHSPGQMCSSSGCTAPCCPAAGRTAHRPPARPHWRRASHCCHQTGTTCTKEWTEESYSAPSLRRLYSACTGISACRLRRLKLCYSALSAALAMPLWQEGEVQSDRKRRSNKHDSLAIIRHLAEGSVVAAAQACKQAERSYHMQYMFQSQARPCRRCLSRTS